LEKKTVCYLATLKLVPIYMTTVLRKLSVSGLWISSAIFLPRTAQLA